MTGSILGERVLRKEDPKFLTTGGVYVDDMDEPLLDGGAARHLRPIDHGARPHHRHRHQRGPASPGVVAVYTAADLGLEPVPAAVQPDGGPPAAGPTRSSATSASPSPPSSRERRDQGEDAAELVEVDYEPLEVLLDVETSVASSTLLYPNAGSNVVFDSTALGHARHDRRLVLRGLRGRRHASDFVNQRVAPCPLEVRGVGRGVGRRPAAPVAVDAARGRRARSRSPRPTASSRTRSASSPPTSAAASAPRSARTRRSCCSAASPRRSGGRCAGGRPAASPWSASATAAPRCSTSRSAAPATARSSPTACTCCRTAAPSPRSAPSWPPFMTRPMSSGVYAIPKIECHTTSVVTNTTPIVAYRGAGRPEATAAVERAMDLFAAEIGMDPAEVRRTNLIPKFVEPHTTVDRPDLRRRRLRGRARQGARRGRLRRAAAPSRPSAARAATPSSSASASASTSRSPAASPPLRRATPASRSLDDGRAVVYTGTSPHGQGHVTAWSMIAVDRHRHPDGQDRRRLGRHRPRAAGRRHDGLALAAAGRRGRAHAAGRAGRARPGRWPPSLLEADAADVVLDKDAGAFHVAGTPAVGQVVGRPGRRRDGRRRPAARPSDVHRRRRRRSRSAPTSPSSRSTPRPARSATCATSPATTPAGSSTRCCSRARSTAASPRARRRRCSRRCATTSDGNPITSNLADYAFISAAELPELRARPHGDPDVRQPARRQGHRRVGHDRLDAGRAVRGDRRAPATSASATSTCRPPPSGCGRPSPPPRPDRPDRPDRPLIGPERA